MDPSYSVSYMKHLLILGAEWIMKSSITGFWSTLSQSYSVYLAEKWLVNIDVTFLQPFQQETVLAEYISDNKLHKPRSCTSRWLCTLPVGCPLLPASSGKELHSHTIKCPQYRKPLIFPGWMAVLPRQFGFKGPNLPVFLEGIFPEHYAPKAFPHSIPGSCLSYQLEVLFCHRGEPVTLRSPYKLHILCQKTQTGSPAMEENGKKRFQKPCKILSLHWQMQFNA